MISKVKNGIKIDANDIKILPSELVIKGKVTFSDFSETALGGIVKPNNNKYEKVYRDKID